MANHITRDPIYNAVAPDDFLSMIEVPRYADRTDAFDAIISATADHFWDPNDPRYIDFDAQPFDLQADMVLPREMIVELHSAVADRLDEGQQIRLANQNARFMLSSILHGEQGALSLSASLCQVLRDPGAQEYAANQAREEARHVAAFARYVNKRWGAPLRAGKTLSTLMQEIVAAPEVYKKLIGMQMLIEGLAMGAFATLNLRSRDPLLRRLVQLVMTDEAGHYYAVSDDFEAHGTVRHGQGEYGIGEFHTNTIEGYFSIFKRGMKGIYQHCGKTHLHRYVAEFDFRYNNRVALGVHDAERAERILKGADGKRLTYRRTDEARLQATG